MKPADSHLTLDGNDPAPTSSAVPALNPEGLVHPSFGVKRPGLDPARCFVLRATGASTMGRLSDALALPGGAPPRSVLLAA